MKETLFLLKFLTTAMNLLQVCYQRAVF